MAGQTREERVARITAKQGIAVAVITAIAGMAGAGIQKITLPESDSQHGPLLTIKSVEVQDHKRRRIRVIAEADGNSFSVPSRAVWLDTGEPLSPETFPLPREPKAHTIWFSVLEESETDPISFTVPPGAGGEQEEIRLFGGQHGAVPKP
jgi:hypothetical protein